MLVHLYFKEVSCGDSAEVWKRTSKRWEGGGIMRGAAWGGGGGSTSSGTARMRGSSKDVRLVRVLTDL